MLNNFRLRSQARDVQALIPNIWPFPPVSRVSRGDPAGHGTDGEADHYGDIRPGVKNL